MNRRELLAATTGVSAVLVTGCLGQSGDPTVELTDQGPDPRDISIEVGETVTWRNEISGIASEETVRSEPLRDDADEWDFEETFEEGEEITHTFEEEGAFTWIGENHGEECMCGVVEVGDASLEDPVPCSPVAGGGC